MGLSRHKEGELRGETGGQGPGPWDHSEARARGHVCRISENPNSRPSTLARSWIPLGTKLGSASPGS